MKTFAIFALALTAAAIAPVAAQEQEYYVPWAELNSGSFVGVSADYNLSATVSTMQINPANSENYQAVSGFWSSVFTVASPPGWMNFGWNWISIPAHPRNPSAYDVFYPDNVENRLFAFDRVNKSYLIFPDDFENMEVGEGYVLWTEWDTDPYFAAFPAAGEFEIALAVVGWSQIGHPLLRDVAQLDLRVRNDVTQEVRTAEEDFDSLDAWVNWNFIYYDSYLESALICSFDGGDDEALHPWYAYRIYSYQNDITLLVPNDLP